MPSGPASPATSAPRSLPRRLLRWSGLALVLVVALFCTLLLAVRYVALPRVESHREDIARWLSGEIRQPVEIDGIVTGWDGWNPRIVVRGLRVRDAAGLAAQPLLELPEVSGAISWTSLLVGDLRLRELSIASPRLAVRRDTDGRVHVAGIEIPEDAGDGDTALTDWLLRQRLIVVRNAFVTWNDDRRNAPQLLLDNVDFRLESRFSQHRFGLTGTPPSEVAAPIDLRGEVSSASLSDWRHGAGRLYLRLDYADVAAWSEWLPLPMTIASGKGAMRVWFEFDEGIARNVVADVELADVRTRLADDLPPLDLAHVAGRLTWQQSEVRRTLAARSLSFALPDGASVAPGDLDLRYDIGADGESTGGRIAFDRVELRPLVALAAQLPLPAGLRDDLARYAVRGTLTDAEYAWEGPLRHPTAFRTRGAANGLGVNARDAMPGLANLSGTFEATQAGGALRIASRNLAVMLPKVFAEPILLDSAAARVRWERKGDSLAVRLDDVEFANAHAAGTAQGSWRSRPSGPGEIDLTARATRADARQLHRYMPLVVGHDTRQWVRDSLVGGSADDARLTLKGDLARFPFADGRSGTFVVTVKARDATLDYANGWPRLQGVDADVRFEGHGLRVEATRGQVLGASIVRAIASVEDMSIQHPVLAIDGEASGPTTEFLRFIDTSPVASWIDRFTDGMQATGNGRLGLKFALALGKQDDVAHVVGDYQFVANALSLPGVPPLAKVTGHLGFTERELVARDIDFEALGGTGRVSLSSKEGMMRVTGDGTANVASVQQHFGTTPTDRLAGSTDWHLDLDARKGTATWTIQSSLRGVTVDLPAPLAKRPEDALPLRIERRPGGPRESVAVDYGSVARVVAQFAPGRDVDRALVLLGKAAQNRGAVPDRAGVVVRGDARSINVDEWLTLARAPAAPSPVAGASTPELTQLDLEAGEFLVFGRRYDDMAVSARRATEAWRMKFSSRQAEGEATWEPAGSKLANGRVVARLARFELAKNDEIRVPPEPPKPGSERGAGSANPWPELDVTAERFVARERSLGRMELAARPEGTDWRITRFALVNDAGRIDADGWWRLVGSRQHTRIDVTIDVRDAGAFLARMGLPADIKAAPAKLDGQLEWPGSPTDFEYPTLSGTFGIRVGAGQFTKLDPGMGKLLGVLSLQALPRRITLDFRDVFSEGFAFDTITGSARIARGVMHTDDLVMAGPAAKVHLAGEVDLDRETQRLSVRVQPSLSSVVSTGAGAAAVALLAANPLVGAAVGAGTLLAQKIMSDPIEQIFSYEYAVSGSWSEPVVERLGARTFPRAGAPQKADGAQQADGAQR
jgi:uncharacterized protein (TIGR02099 family)